MNIQETKKILAILWSYYPNAPKLDPDSMALMSLSWARMFAEFNILDVMNAVQEAVKESLKFVPTAPEILKHCRKTLKTPFSIDEYMAEKFLVTLRGIPESRLETSNNIILNYENAVKKYRKQEADKWEEELKRWMKPALEAK